ncbi:MAG: UDP-N-acetylglucosamine--N-acetylmuramyl-(pentapeptide) pyrophosphoryl-undecaprenol N-acetylglucosamine transferase [Candidatus Sumerlaeaceae bacterium]|nr:UDP-N-acetylglucosamine--N-acetylmuramyl-(pentapeptide) pyrophosphoryl-undecaprenol N-acetylglucosamine transferase [Candidatus Sumerlaeaceae bacterium]
MSATNSINIMIAAGGTGGHIIPAIALGRALEKAAPVNIFYVCGNRSVELDLYHREGIQPIVMGVRQLGKALFQRLGGSLAAATVAGSLWNFIRRHNIRAVVGFGGYVSGPAILAGILARRRTLIHEANSVAGRTNRWVAPWVDVVAVNFAAACQQMRAKQCEVVGMPIRDDVFCGNREEAYRHFGLDPRKRTLLVLGGSQGALYLYRALLQALPHLDVPEFGDLQILWSTGVANFDELSHRLEENALRWLSVKLVPFIARMDLALACADAAVSRAGASTCAELSAVGIYTLYIPLPTAIYDHQRRNADELTQAGVGLQLPENEMSPERTANIIKKLLSEAPAKREYVAKYGQIHRDAATKLARRVLDLAFSRRP